LRSDGENSPGDKPSVVVLFGPTGSGKTQLLNKVLPQRGELINSDSIQIYQHLNIGSAKPTAEELRLYPHHLVDCLDPKEAFTAGTFCRRAEPLVKEIAKKGRVPVISGGTGFYFKTLLMGGAQTPEADPLIRKEVQEEQDRRGLDWLYQKLFQFDHAYAKKIAPQDALRIRRAMEVYRQTGRPLSSFTLPEGLREDWKISLLGIRWPREELYRRIEERVDQMIALGLEAEVQGLLAMEYRWEDPGLQAIGYKEWSQYFEGEISRQEVIRLIKRNSRRYAKRQITFFKGLPGVVWLPGERQDEAIASLKMLINLDSRARFSL
jgi:tRNA dimethylallyltransferase